MVNIAKEVSRTLSNVLCYTRRRCTCQSLHSFLFGYGEPPSLGSEELILFFRLVGLVGYQSVHPNFYDAR